MRFIKILSLFLIFVFQSFANEDPSLIFYNNNDLSFEHCEKILKQAKLFNPNIKIYFIDSLKSRSKNLDSLKKLGVAFTPSESIRKSSIHKKYDKIVKDRILYREESGKDSYSKWFVIHDFIAHINLKNSFFIDMDTLIYLDFKEYFGIFQNFYPKLAAAFENEEFSSHSILYIHDKLGLEKLNKFILKESLNFPKPAKLFGNFKREYGKDHIDNLPIIPDDYAEETILISLDGNKPKDKKDFSKNFTVFNSIFDSCAIGEYLAGVNLEFGFKQIGHINSRSILNPYHFRFDFSKDERGRKVPFMHYKGQKIKINDLKIESLQIDNFLSF